MKRNRSDSSECYDQIDGPVGTVYLIFRGAVLTGLSFEKPGAGMPRKSGSSAEARRELTEYFGQKRREFGVRTAFTEGTDFEKQVWEALKEIPYGETRTYKWVAEKIGKPHACRAVGNALGKNPIAIVYPCHRVIESDGSLGGYSSGSGIKRRLLEMEYYGKLSGR